MNKYGLPLTASISQTIIPAMSRSGLVYGFYPISAHTFTGSETSYALSDLTIPLTTVTVDSDAYVKQYMAAVWPLRVAENYKPWASSTLIAPGDGYYSWWSLPTESWLLHFGKGTLMTALTSNMGKTVTMPGTPSAPVVSTPQSLTFNGSVKYSSFTGNCSFVEFNWVNLFTSTSEMVPLSIIPLTNPTGMVAKVVGVPTATQNGVLYDTIRIIRLVEELTIGTYTFTFRVMAVNGLYSDVTLNLSVA